MLSFGFSSFRRSEGSHTHGTSQNDGRTGRNSASVGKYLRIVAVHAFGNAAVLSDTQRRKVLGASFSFLVDFMQAVEGILAERSQCVGLVGIFHCADNVGIVGFRKQVARTVTAEVAYVERCITFWCRCHLVVFNRRIGEIHAGSFFDSTQHFLFGSLGTEG